MSRTTLRSIYAWLVFGLGLILTGFTTLEVKRGIEQDAARQFAFTSDQVALKLQERLSSYALILRGAAGLFAGSSTVDRAEWRAYVEKLRAADSVPGVQGIGFSLVIPPQQLSSHVAAIRREGFPDYSVRPPGERELYTSIIYLEPFQDRNLRAFGFDMFSEPIRRAAMRLARDTGAPALTGRVELVQETGKDVQAGTLMYVPVYRNGVPTETPEQRQRALIGWAYSPYRMNDLMAGVLADWDTREGKTVDLHIYDAADAGSRNLLFDSRPDSYPDAAALFRQQRIIDFGGRRWLLEFNAVKGATIISYAMAWATAVAGSLLSALLAGLMLALSTTQIRAREIAGKLTEDVRRREAEIVDQRRRLVSIIEGTHVGTWEWNVQTGAVVFNERWADIVGYTLDELAPVSIETWSKLVHPEDAEVSRVLLNRHFAGESSFYVFEARMRHKDGRWVWVLDRGRVATWTPDGKPLLMSGTHQDITERKEGEQRLLEARQQADAANIAKSQFLATMSHEIRTPMNGILGMAQLLLKPEMSEADRRDYARTIVNSGQTLLILLNDILDLSKVEAGKLVLESLALDPAQLLHENEMLFSESVAGKGLRIITGWHGPALHYIGDPHRLRQMVSNLVSNAIKFTEQGEIRVDATELERDDNVALLEFSVRDTGIGIPTDKLGLLFQAFSQTDSSTTRQFGGSGLGLSIVRSLAELMGGSVGVESTPGKGSRFWFRIRAAVAAQGVDYRALERAATVAAQQAAGDSAMRLAGRVLVVEDNPTNQKVIRAFLESLGLECRIADDGEQGVAIVTGAGTPAGAPDLVLMDLHMPALDGYGATRRIRQWETEAGRSRCPIIALTADAFAEDEKRCIEAGMNGYLTKPVDFGALKSALARWLRAAPDVAVGAANGPATGSTDIPVFSETVFLSQLGGNKTLGRAIALSALDDMPRYFVQLEKAVSDGRWPDAELATHTMKSLAAQVGGLRLAEFMKTADVGLKAGHPLDAEDLARLRAAYQDMEQSLQQWMQE